MKNNKKWYIGDVSLLSEVGYLRISNVQIVDNDGELICSIRTLSQPIARKIVDCVNEYEELKLEVEKLKNKLKQCEDLIDDALEDEYYIKFCGADICDNILNVINKEE